MLGLLAAAGFPLTLEDLARLSGRGRGTLSALLPEHSVVGIQVDERGFCVDGPDTVARIVRGLYRGPLAPGVENRAPVRDRALLPFRQALDAAAESAATEWGWAKAMPFLLGPDYPRSLQNYRSRRRLLIAMLSDPARQRILAAGHPDAAQEQSDDAARWLARTATSTADLVDLATILISAGRARPSDGTPPHGLPPLSAFTGDLDRALRLAEAVRIEPDIERAYVGEAATRSGMPEGAQIARDAAEAVLARGAAEGALLRVAQALAGTALHCRLAPEAAAEDYDTCRELALLTVRLVTEAFSGPELIPELSRLSQKIFSGARDHERALAAATLATAAAALTRASDRAGAREALEHARALAEQIGPNAHRARTLARMAARLSHSRGLSGEVGEVADDALRSAGTDPAALAEVARLLGGTAVPSAADPDPPRRGAIPQAVAAAASALDAIIDGAVSGGELPPRAALRDAAAVGGVGAVGLDGSDSRAVLAARAVLEIIESSRHPTTLERGTRARTEAVVAAEAAAILGAAGWPDEAAHAAHTALEATGRIPVAARARPLAEVAAALLPARGALFTSALEAADAERRGGSSYWDADAAEAVAVAAADALPGGGDHTDQIAAVLDASVLSLRRHEYTAGIVRLADRLARAGDLERAARLARDALLSAHAPDPIVRARARDALAAEDLATGTTTETPPVSRRGRGKRRRAAERADTVVSPASLADPASGTTALALRQTARHWVTDGYPASGLAQLRATDPAAAARVTALIRADLEFFG